ncbi:hypothetical protein KQX54_018001 [Cotesia glomerata]|uniref:Uncharacterized protein n=1 Tax=Cotesia glomerata TaxID=32391 RepID=A0AAV7IAI3_COTGL|nr:hypothetical protein KQX54_018001 [Cotesia glomerata]
MIGDRIEILKKGDLKRRLMKQVERKVPVKLVAELRLVAFLEPPRRIRARSVWLIEPPGCSDFLMKRATRERRKKLLVFWTSPGQHDKRES